MDGNDDILQPLREQFFVAQQSTADAERRTREMADRLADALAGLPHEVRFLGRPANETECAAMLESLPLFEQLADRAGLTPRYKPLVERCRMHFSNYRRFLQSSSSGQTYAEFQ